MRQGTPKRCDGGRPDDLGISPARMSSGMKPVSKARDDAKANHNVNARDVMRKRDLDEMVIMMEWY